MMQGQQGHSKMALLGSAVAGGAAAMFGHHLMSGGGNNNNAPANNMNGNGGMQNTHAFSQSSGEPRSRGAPFVFWTPNDPGSATCKTDKPSRGFPAATPQESNAAWPSGHQPQNLECWHKDTGGAFKACWYTKVLFETERGWPGKCQGLMTTNPGSISCKESCVRSPECPVWQTYWEGQGELICAQGRGTDCAGMRHGNNRMNVNEA